MLAARVHCNFALADSAFLAFEGTLGNRMPTKTIATITHCVAFTCRTVGPVLLQRYHCALCCRIGACEQMGTARHATARHGAHVMAVNDDRQEDREELACDCDRHVDQ